MMNVKNHERLLGIKKRESRYQELYAANLCSSSVHATQPLVFAKAENYSVKFSVQ